VAAKLDDLNAFLVEAIANRQAFLDGLEVERLISELNAPRD
jgi:hypothetical protein